MIWIRKEDNDKWVALENRSEWLHNALNGDLVKLEYVSGQKIADEINPSRKPFQPPAHKTFFKEK